jgi:hypothetical protein
MQMGYGEFDWSDAGFARGFLRQQFLTAITSNAPEVFEDLRESVLPAFRQLDNLERQLSWRDITPPSQFNSERVTAVRQKMQQWSSRLNLTEYFCEEVYNEMMISFLRLNHARSQPPLTKNQPEAADHTTQHAQSQSPPDSVLDAIFTEWLRDDATSLPAPPDGLKRYWPLYVTREEYLNDIKETVLKRFQADPLLMLGEPSQRAAFIQTVVTRADAYCSDVEHFYEQIGYVRCKQKRKLRKHLQWAVEYQIQGRGWTEIAEKHNVTVQGVEQAVTQLFKAADLPLRTSPQGRPPGSKESVEGSVRRKLGRG